MIFPTRLKVKISSAISYPVGAELISSALAGVPRAQNIEISFHSNYETMKTRGKPYSIFQVAYQKNDPLWPGWSIAVYPVPRALKHQVKECLASEFFPQIRGWLEKQAGVNRRHGGCWMRVVFDEFGETLLTLEESHTPGEAFTRRSGRQHEA